MKKYIFTISMVLVLPLFVSAVVTKPGPDADTESLSYVFFMYYNNGQLVFDRDYEIKFDILSEKFLDQGVPIQGGFKLEVLNFKNEVIKTIGFNPQGTVSGFQSGKVQVKAPYVTDGMWTKFYDGQGKDIGSIYIGMVAVCNDDGLCDASGGENDKTCAIDCKKSTPRPTNTTPPIADDSTDYTMILIYAVGGLGVLVGSWFGWKWWKRRGEDNFMPPPPMPQSPSGMMPPLPPTQ